ncbi:disease resistance protein RPM1-like isoform X2 [Zingiber officinale]|uniref:disease resistance protein RPM1-like isoform X2 n=1 Tax=Zingiber officinale TaxID=94328 RepID=UPI001C4AB61C|nr:disease resistance protein RPM1-like isoform X2 [Zingiber officinale]
MEAAFISLLINKLAQVAFNQAHSRCSQILLQHTTPPLDQIHARVRRITDEFIVMKAFLEGSNWFTIATNKPLEAWIEQVRKVAFEIEDIIDEYLYLVGRQRERTWKNCLTAPSDLCFNLAKAWRGIDSRLEKMERDLSELSSRRDRFGITISGNEDGVKNSERDTHHYRAYSPMLNDEDDLVGIEVNKSKLLSWLTNADTCRKMTAIAVWGMGGHGKTTLVADVYRNNTVKSHFDCQAFRRENNKDCPQELEDYTGRILNKCQGSPLAIVAIGSLLSFKEKSETEWKKVYDNLQWEFENNPVLDKVKNILNLSFNDLPYYLKNCFVFCSIFPEDYLINRKKLIRLWVAEGFVEAKSSNRSMEEEAEDYLAELVDRSMLQVVNRNAFGRLHTFKMHDVVREVTLAISRKAKFSMILDGSQSGLDFQTRRLSIQTNDESLDLDRSLSLSQLRSLVMFSTCNSSSDSLRAVLTSFKMLRVLELEGTPISNLPNEISALFNLHYLCLRDTEVEKLPNNIQKLQSLETLDLSGSNIVKLPRGVTQLKQLRHLFMFPCEIEFGGSTVVGCVPTLKGAWQWKNLQTLRHVKANKNLFQQLEDMKELRTLAVTEVEYAHCPQLCTSLTKLTKLHSLSLSARSEEQLNFEILNSPPPPLQKLVLCGRLFEGKMPRFICSCEELTDVLLFSSHLIEDPLPSLGQLHKLVELTLWGDSYDGQKLHFRTGWFLNLKVLFLDTLTNLNNIVIEEGAMPNLLKLIMRSLGELRMIPPGIEFLANLQSLDLCNMPEELVEKLRNDDDNEDRQRIRGIPNVVIGLISSLIMSEICEDEHWL